MVKENLAVWQILKSQYTLDGEVLLQDICTVDTTIKESYFDAIVSISTFEHIHNQSKHYITDISYLNRVGGLQ